MSIVRCRNELVGYGTKGTGDGVITRKQFADEERRIKQLRKQGWTDHYPNGGIKSWLRGWRAKGRTA